MRETIYRFLWETWHMFWYRLVYRQERYGNLRKQINRFTGDHKVYKVHPLARVGITFSQEEADHLNKLFGDGRTFEAQQLILQDIQKEMDFGDLAEAFMEAARQIEESTGKTMEEAIDASVQVWKAENTKECE